MSRFFIVVDMQNDFIDPKGALPTPDAEKVRNRIAWYIEQAMTKDDYIIFTRDTHNSKFYYDTQEGRKLPVMHCERYTWGWEVDKQLLDAAYQAVGMDRVFFIDKSTFGTTDLGQGQFALLNQLSIKMTDDIEICGVCTDICVVSNALILHSQFPQSRMICAADMCAGTSREAHWAALTVMRSCQIEVFTHEI